jgi:3-hydroxyisobutyrate dehydrogenase-like beta-hydroxyacid dehydrogenase
MAQRLRIGFVGIGLMGHGMAINLVRKGWPLTFKAHRNRSRLGDLLAAGAREVATAAELGPVSDVVILCVTGSPQVEETVFGIDGRGGLVDTVREGQLVVDTSTSEPQSTARIRDALARRGVDFVDAPLARTPKDAEEGRLNAMVGASDETFARVEPVLRAFCENVFHVGPPGAGHTLKLVNNFMAMTIAASIAEAFAVAARAGVRLDKLVEVVSQGALNSGIFQMMGRGAAEGDLTRMKFSISNAAKDMRYYTHLAESLPIATHVGEAVHQSFQQAVALGLGDELVPSMIEAQERLTGLRIVER